MTRSGWLQGRTLEDQGEDYPPGWTAHFAGGKVGHGPFDTPFGRIALVNDPAGAVFSVLQPTAAG